MSEEDREEYRERSREAKRKVAQAKKREWDDARRGLTTEEGRKRLFRMARQMRKERKDITGKEVKLR